MQKVDSLKLYYLSSVYARRTDQILCEFYTMRLKAFFLFFFFSFAPGYQSVGDRSIPLFVIQTVRISTRLYGRNMRFRRIRQRLLGFLFFLNNCNQVARTIFIMRARAHSVSGYKTRGIPKYCNC